MSAASTWNNITVIGNAGYGIFAQATVYLLGTDCGPPTIGTTSSSPIPVIVRANPWSPNLVTGPRRRATSSAPALCPPRPNVPVTVDPGVDVQIVGQRAATVADAC